MSAAASPDASTTTTCATPRMAVLRGGCHDGCEVRDPRTPWIEAVEEPPPIPTTERPAPPAELGTKSLFRTLLYERVPDRVDEGRAVFALAGTVPTSLGEVSPFALCPVCGTALEIDQSGSRVVAICPHCRVHVP